MSNHNENFYHNNEKLNTCGMKFAEREHTMTSKMDIPQASQNDIVRHLVDGDVVEADKKLMVLSAEAALERCESSLENLKEVREYYSERLARWEADVASWPEGKDFKYDGICFSTSPNMEKLRMEDFESYKKFIKAGRGLPYYKEYDVNGVKLTQKAIRTVDKGIDYLLRRIEEFRKLADSMTPTPNKVVPELGFNADHWNWVKDFSWRKVNDIEHNAHKWSTELLFKTLTAVRNKLQRAEFTKYYAYWAQGLIFRELSDRTGNSSYGKQYQAMREAFRAQMAQKETPVEEDIEEDELELNLPQYQVPNYGLSEDEIIAYLDR